MTMHRLVSVPGSAPRTHHEVIQRWSPVGPGHADIQRAWPFRMPAANAPVQALASCTPFPLRARRWGRRPSRGRRGGAALRRPGGLRPRVRRRRNIDSLDPASLRMSTMVRMTRYDPGWLLGRVKIRQRSQRPHCGTAVSPPRESALKNKPFHDPACHRQSGER